MGQKKEGYEVVQSMKAKNLLAALRRVALWIPNHILGLAFWAVLIVVVIFQFIAPGLGKAAGLAVGSFEGMTSGIEEGAKAGKEAGLSAEDVKIRLGNEMKETEKLQILLVDMKLADIYQQGDKYAALLSREGEAAFTVDLAQTRISLDKASGRIVIEIPEPEFEFYLDDSTFKVLDGYEKEIFDGSTKDGYTGYLNSREEVIQKAKEEIGKNKVILEQAKTAALQQVEALAKAICANNPTEIRFSEAEE